jgi:hypothetical protein
MTRDSASSVWLWFAFLGAPIAWAIHLMAIYLLVPVACITGTTLALQVVNAGTLAAAVLAGVVGWLHVRRPEGDSERTRQRVRFMARAAIVFSVFFSLVIVAESLPSVLDDPCQHVGVGSTRRF